jgi:DNA-binding XRE family transcriptional regulator
MSGKYIQPHQTQSYMKGRELGHSQQESAQVANISERSGRRIEAGQHQPKAGGKRSGRTRPDPLEAVWINELEPMLLKEPKLEPTTLYEYLIKKYPGQYQKCLRTLQRRVHHWKATQGKPKEIMFPMLHPPGVMGLSDFTQLKKITVTIGGQEFKHLLYHYRLAYSGVPLTILRKPQNTRSTPGNTFRSSKEEKASSAYHKVFRTL